MRKHALKSLVARAVRRDKKAQRRGVVLVRCHPDDWDGRLGGATYIDLSIAGQTVRVPLMPTGRKMNWVSWKYGPASRR